MPRATPTYRFNAQTQWPKTVDTQVQQLLQAHEGQPLTFSQHAYDQANRANGFGVHPDTIPGLNGQFPSQAKGWNPVEVEHDGHRVTKLVMRGPFNEQQDAVIPIIPARPGGSPLAKTVWTNGKKDQHKTLDLNTVHTPEEFAPGKPPKRPLVTLEQRKARGYQPVEDSPKVRDLIQKKFVHPPNQE